MASIQQPVAQQTAPYDYFAANVVPYIGDYAWLQGLSHGVGPTKPHPCPGPERPKLNEYNDMLVQRFEDAGKKRDENGNVLADQTGHRNKYGGENKVWFMPNVKHLEDIRAMRHTIDAKENTTSVVASFRHKVVDHYFVHGDLVVESVRDRQSGTSHRVPLVARERYYDVLLWAHRDVETGAHRGRDSTYAKLHAWFSSKGLTKDLCEDFITVCPDCPNRKKDEEAESPPPAPAPKPKRATTQNNGVQKRAPKAKKGANTTLKTAAARTIDAGPSNSVAVSQGQFGHLSSSAPANQATDAYMAPFSADPLSAYQDRYGQSFPAVDPSAAFDTGMPFPLAGPMPAYQHQQGQSSQAVDSFAGLEASMLSLPADPMSAYQHQQGQPLPAFDLFACNSMPAYQGQYGQPLPAVNTTTTAMDPGMAPQFAAPEAPFQGQYAQPFPAAPTTMDPSDAMVMSLLGAWHRANPWAQAAPAPVNTGNPTPSPVVTDPSLASAPASRRPSSPPTSPDQAPHGDSGDEIDLGAFVLSGSGELVLEADPAVDAAVFQPGQANNLDFFDPSAMDPGLFDKPSQPEDQ